jgi:hypothetical protein
VRTSPDISAVTRWRIPDQRRCPVHAQGFVVQADRLGRVTGRRVPFENEDSHAPLASSAAAVIPTGPAPATTTSTDADPAQVGSISPLNTTPA